MIEQPLVLQSKIMNDRGVSRMLSISTLIRLVAYVIITGVLVASAAAFAFPELSQIGTGAAVAIGQPALAENDTSSDRPIVMVCEHGTVKSVMASEYFNSEARKRGRSFRAVSRVIDPDAKVPDNIVSALAADGINVSDFEPRILTAEDANQSPLLVAIGVDLTGFGSGDEKAIVQWNDIPPASVDFEASRAAMMIHIDELLDDLENHALSQ